MAKYDNNGRLRQLEDTVKSQSVKINTLLGLLGVVLSADGLSTVIDGYSTHTHNYDDSGINKTTQPIN